MVKAAKNNPLTRRRIGCGRRWKIDRKTVLSRCTKYRFCILIFVKQTNRN